MATALTTQFTTEYDGTGTDQMVSGLDGIEQKLEAVDVGANRFFESTNTLARRLERPLGYLAFSGLAEDITSATGATTRAVSPTFMLERALHTVGETLLFVAPEFTGLAIGIIAVTELFQHLTEKVKTADETLLENVKTEVEGVKVREEAVDTLKKFGLADEQVTNDLLSSSKKRRDAAIAELKEKAELLKTEIGNQTEMVKHTQDMANTISDIQSQNKPDYNTLAYARQAQVAVTGQLTDKEKQLAVIEETLSKMASEETPLLDKKNNANKQTINILAEQYKTLDQLMRLQEANDKSKVKMGDDQWIKDQITSLDQLGVNWKNAEALAEMTQQNIIELERQLTNAKTEEDKKQLQSKIATLNAQLSAEQSVANTEQQIKQQRAQEASRLSNELLGDSRAFMEDYVKGNKDNLNKDLANWIDAYANKLFAAAIADAFLDPIKAAAELAGAAALWALAGTTGGSSGGAASSSSASNASNSPGMVNVQVNFLGGSLSDPGALAIIMKGITKQVVTGNGQIVTTQVNGNGASQPGIVA